jgi:ATP-dependent DNA ligase
VGFGPQRLFPALANHRLAFPPRGYYLASVSRRTHPKKTAKSLRVIMRSCLFAFDLLELGGKDLRRTQLEERKGVLAKLVRKGSWAVQLNEHIAERGDIVFRHACKLGLEGIVSKRLGSPYVSRRSRHWIKSKNPAAPVVKREAEEDWGKRRRR